MIFCLFLDVFLYLIMIFWWKDDFKEVSTRCVEQTLVPALHGVIFLDSISLGAFLISKMVFVNLNRFKRV